MSAVLDRLGSLSGAAFALLFGFGSALTLVGSPALGGAPNEIRTYFLDQEQNIYVGGVLSMLSVPFLIWFTAYVRSAIVQHERSPRLLSTIAFGSGVAASAVVAAEVMALTVGAIRVGEAGDISSDTAAVLFDLSTGFGGIGVPVTLAAMQLAFAAAALRYRQLVSGLVRPWDDRDRGPGNDHPVQLSNLLRNAPVAARGERAALLKRSRSRTGLAYSSPALVRLVS